MNKNIFYILSFLLLIPFCICHAQTDNRKLFYNIIDGKYDLNEMPFVAFTQDDNYAVLTDEGRYVIKYNITTGEPIDTLFRLSMIKDSSLLRIDGYELSPDNKKMLVATHTEKNRDGSEHADYYVNHISENRIEKLSEDGKQQVPTFSPNGRMIAFVRDNNIFLKKLDFDTETAVTEDGKAGEIINGIPPQLYRKEFGTPKFIEWSSDGKLIAFLRFDETDVKEFCIESYPDLYDNDDFLRFNIDRHCSKYPTPGTKNPSVSVQVYDVFYKSIKEMDIPVKDDIYIPRIMWTRTIDQLGIITLDRTQTQLNIVTANAKTTVAKIIFKDNGSKPFNIKNIHNIRFLAGNLFLYPSEKNGYNHLYTYSMTGFPKQQLTDGEWDVTDYYGYDPVKKVYYYQSTEASPLERNIYSVQAEGGKRTQLTREQGVNNITFSKSFNYFLNNFSSLETPNYLSIHNASGVAIDTLIDNTPLAEKIQQDSLYKKEFFTFLTTDSVTLNGWMIKPSIIAKTDTVYNVDQYPVILMLTDNGEKQSVRNEWMPMGWEQYMAEKNYIIVCIDSRGTEGRGAAFRHGNYKQAGLMEAQDQIDAAHYLATLPYVDKDRIALVGWGKGAHTGLLAMSICEDNIFKAGIAIAPITDWRLYNSVYTERHMNRPQENIDNYKQSSLIERAEQLDGKVLLIHGTADEDVYVQHTRAYHKRLTEIGKQVNIRLYMDADHDFSFKNDRIHLYNEMSEFIFNNL